MKNAFSSVRTDEHNPIWQQSIQRENSLYARGNDIRSEFERDYTRLLHSLAYRRLKHKTQVFFAPHNDHICTRMEHVNHVASVSTTIAKYLGLNVELTQAIAIGHDIGHAPFGHAGEEILNSLMQQKEGRNAPKKSDGTEKCLNLTYAVRDGLICHCGEIDQQGLTPRTQAMNLYDIKRPGTTNPFTWEGCVVKVSDKIAFLGRDIEDARTYHILDMASYRQLREIVEGTLGFTPGHGHSTANGVHRSGRAVNTTVLINDMIVDLCTQSLPEKGLCFSEAYFNFITELKKFSFANIYNNWRLVEFQNYAREVLGCIYRVLMKAQVYTENGNLEQYLRYVPKLSSTFCDWIIKYTNYDKQKKEALKKQAEMLRKQQNDYPTI